MKRLPLHIPGILAMAIVVFLVGFAGNSQAQSDSSCFAETGYCIQGRIREYWQENGGLPVFGYPITPQQGEIVEGQSFQVQWFERNRLELHPENQPPYDVLLGRLGVDRLQQAGQDWYTFPQGAAQDGCLFFEETMHSVCGDILAAWRANGLEFDGVSGKSQAENLALFGLPVSEPRTETLSDGNAYTVQWFERARFELHPENQPPYHVLLGLLGREFYDNPLMPIEFVSDQSATPSQTPVEQSIPVAEPTKDVPPAQTAAATTVPLPDEAVVLPAPTATSTTQGGGFVTPDSSVLSPPRATATQAAAYIIQRGTTYSDYSVQEIVGYYWTIGQEVGVDPLLAISQCLHETDNLKSWWAQRPRRNPAGLGVTGETSTDPPPTGHESEWAYNEEEQLWRKGLSFETWEQSAKAHIGRLLAYALKDGEATEQQRALIAYSLSLRALPETYRGVAPTLRGLNGRWAFPGETYADKIVQYATAIQGQ